MQHPEAMLCLPCLQWVLQQNRIKLSRLEISSVCSEQARLDEANATLLSNSALMMWLAVEVRAHATHSRHGPHQLVPPQCFCVLLEEAPCRLVVLLRGRGHLLGKGPSADVQVAGCFLQAPLAAFGCNTL